MDDKETIRRYFLFSKSSRTGAAGSLAKSKAPRAPRSTWQFLGAAKGLKYIRISYAIRSIWPDLKVRLHALDISKEILEFAEAGVYSLRSHDGTGAPNRDDLVRGRDVSTNTLRDQPLSMFERVSPEEMVAMFDREGDQVTVKPPFRDGIIWHVGDAEILVSRRFGSSGYRGSEPVPVPHVSKGGRSVLAQSRAFGQARRIPFVSGVDLDVEQGG